MSRKMRSVAAGRWWRIVSAVFVIVLGFSSPVGHLIALPRRIEVPVGQYVRLPWSRWLPVSISADSPSEPTSVQLVGQGAAINVAGHSLGHYLIRFHLFGWIPWKPIPVDVTKPVYEVPGGESIGVLVHTKGLVVTGYTNMSGVNPAQKAGVKPGDVITQIGPQVALSDRVLADAIARAGRTHAKLKLTLTGRKRRVRWIEPVWSKRLHRFQSGMAVEDRASGVGTMTFYSPQTGHYAALGHSMTDGLTKIPAPVAHGKILGANVVSIVRGTPNTPGQKVGVLSGPNNIDGSVQTNGMFGITGYLRHRPMTGKQKPMPIALPDQVRPGPATIETVIHGQQPEQFRINIVKTRLQFSPQTKGLLFKVTDPKLLAKTGGIIQGMSGSPIIQRGKIVGAVTHVLISRPTVGYGCYAYWMVKQKAFG